MDYNQTVIEPGDRFSGVARQVCLASHENNEAVIVHSANEELRSMDGFSWARQVQMQMLHGECYQVPQSDGAGGKPQFFTLLNSPEAYHNLGWEVITMNADDIACRGGYPALMLSSNIDVKAITEENWPKCQALLEGFGDALSESGLVLMTGETAVMGQCITAFCDTDDPSELVLTWGASCLGLASMSVPPVGSDIVPGMTIVGLKDNGYRCNGGTRLVDLLIKTWGPKICDIRQSKEAMKFATLAVEPSRSYARTISSLYGWDEKGIHWSTEMLLEGAAHITGGGVWSKLGEILPTGVGANLFKMSEPPEILSWAQELSLMTGNPISDYECYRTFHGGCGAMLICPEDHVDHVCELAENDGHTPEVIGVTTSSGESEITIRSRFREGGILSSLGS